jgi:hypothetical protein
MDGFRVLCSCAGILGSRFCPRGSNPAAWVLQSGGMCYQSHPSEPEPGKQSYLFSNVIYISALVCGCGSGSRFLSNLSHRKLNFYMKNIFEGTKAFLKSNKPGLF